MRITYIIPTRNRAHMVGKTIQSIIHQPHPDKEIWVIDDDSSDGLRAVVDLYKVPYLHYFHPGQHVGQNRARNIGVEKASGDIVTILDSDDQDLGTNLQCVVDAFDRYPNIIGVFTPVVSMSRGNLLGKVHGDEMIFSQKGFVDGSYVGEYQPFLLKKKLPNNVFVEGLGVKRSCTMLTWLELGKDHEFIIINQKTRLYNDVHSERFGNINNIIHDARELSIYNAIMIQKCGQQIFLLAPKAYNDLVINLAYYDLLSNGRKVALSHLGKIRGVQINFKRALAVAIFIIVGPYLTGQIRRRFG